MGGLPGVGVLQSTPASKSTKGGKKITSERGKENITKGGAV